MAGKLARADKAKELLRLCLLALTVTAIGFGWAHEIGVPRSMAANQSMKISIQGASLTNGAVDPRIWFFVNDPAQRRASGFATQNFADLFSPNAPWQEGLSATNVFGISEYSARIAPPDELQKIFALLDARHIAFATSGEMDVVGPDRCGENIASYTLNPQALREMAVRIKQLGGTLSYVDMDEPLFFGRARFEKTVGEHVYHGCQYQVRRIADGVAKSIDALRSVFPD